MLNRFIYGLCLAALLFFITKESWKPDPVSPYAVVGAIHAHEKSFDGKGVVVAVLDEGFDSSHASLKDKFSSLHRYNTGGKKHQDVSESLIYENGKYTFDNHGTHVSGIILNLAPEAKIIPIKIEGFGGDQSFVKALQFAANSPAHIVNISMRLSYTSREISPNVRTALFQLAQAGKLIVIAAGNDSAPLMQHAYTASLVELSNNPLMKGRLLLVGASSYKDGVESLAEFSNFPGRGVVGKCQTYFITAPGEHIRSTITGGFFAEKSGTSMAAPMVAGAASLLKQAYPHLSAESIIQLLLQSARKISLDGKSLPYNQFGAGILSLKEAIENG
jgi:subtilisin family serine protease